MLKETRTEETIRFFVIFLLLVAFHYGHTLRFKQSHSGSDARYGSEFSTWAFLPTVNSTRRN